MNFIHLALVSLLFAQPLLFSPFTYLAFELPKALALFIFSTVIGLNLVRKFSFKGFNLQQLIVLTLFLWFFTTSVIGVNFQHSFFGNYFRLNGLITQVCFLILFLTSGLVFSHKLWRHQIAWALVFSSTSIAVLAIAQFVTLWFLGNDSQLLYDKRVISTFGQPNFLGSFLVMSLPFAWYLYKGIHPHPSLRARFLSGVAIFIVILGIFSTLSRSAYLGLAVLALIWGIKHYKLLLTGIVFSVLLFSIMATVSPKLVYQQWSRFQIDFEHKWTAENRISIAEKSTELIAKNPLFGVGLENFILVFPTILNEGDLGLKDIVVDSAHNIFLDLGVETGLIGLSLFLTFCIFILAKGLNRLKHEGFEEKNFTLSQIMVILTFLVSHQFSVVSLVPLTSFWVSAGYLASSPFIYTHSEQKNNKILFYISAGLILLVGYFIVQSIRADIIFRNSSSLEVSDIQKSIKMDNQAISIAPWVQFYTWRRDFLLKQLGY